MIAAAWIALFAPAAAVVLIALAGTGISRSAAGFVAAGSALVSFVCSVIVFAVLLGESPEERIHSSTLWTWLSAGNLKIGAEIQVDPLSVFMSAATKVAALVLTMRLLVTAFPAQEHLWTISLAVIVCISLAWGNVGALVQTDVKRMLAYSSISHAGFLLMPVAVATPLGGRALMYYLISYAAMSVGAFAVVAARERELARPVTLEGMAGMGWERPGLGAAMTLFMFGFIGLPPAGLFIGKFYAFSAAVDRGWAWLAVVGAIATVVSIYYYLGVVRAMYFQPAVRVAPAGGSPPRELALGTSVALAVVVTIGSFIAAQPLLDIATDAVSFLPFPH